MGPCCVGTGCRTALRYGLPLSYYLNVYCNLCSFDDDFKVLKKNRNGQKMAGMPMPHIWAYIFGNWTEIFYWSSGHHYLSIGDEKFKL